MRPLYLSPPHMSGNEQKYINEVFESNYIAPLGAFVNKFEELIKNYTKTPNALAVSSGTAAIHLALRVLGIKENDDVLASTFTFIGSINAILYQKANPIFLECDSSWNLDPVLLTNYLNTTEKKPKALIITHLYGQISQMEKIAHICKSHNIYLIEDAAESLGASLNNQQSGTFGDFGIFSFNGNKILTTSGGGMLISPNKTWIDKALFYATQAKDDKPYYEHTEYGYNYRMSNVLAAIGVAQMEVLQKRVNRKREIFELYHKELTSLNVKWMPEIENSIGNRWLSTFTHPELDPDSLMKYLSQFNIESRHLWKPMHLQPLFQDAQYIGDNYSELLFKTGICLPCGTAMSNEEVVFVSNKIKDFFLCLQEASTS